MKIMLHCDKGIRFGFGWDTIQSLWPANARALVLRCLLYAFLCVALSSCTRHQRRQMTDAEAAVWAEDNELCRFTREHFEKLHP